MRIYTRSDQLPSGLSRHVSRRFALWIGSLGSGFLFLMLIGYGGLALERRYGTLDLRVILAREATFYGFGWYGESPQLVTAALSAPARLLRQIEIPAITLDVKFKHMNKLNEQRARALANGYLLSSDTYFPASIGYAGQSIPCGIRLKGDLLDHLDTDKWSVRVKVKGEIPVFGLKRFSLQHPKTRGFQGDALFHESLKTFGLLAPQVSFARVFRNGEDIGIMEVEEHLTKDFLELQGRRESVTLHFDESVMWKSVQGGRFGFSSAYDNFRTSTVLPFQDASLRTSPKLALDYGIAVGLLRAFMEGRLPASAVFEPVSMGQYLALIQFWGSWHAMRWHNLRFYFNPVTMRIEPVGFDADINRRSQVGSVNEPIQRAMLADSVIYQSYVNGIRGIVSAMESGLLPGRLDAVEQRFLPVLQKEFFLLEPFSKIELATRAAALAAIDTVYTEPAQPVQPATSQMSAGLKTLDFPVQVFAYLIARGTNATRNLELVNPLPYPIVVEKVVWAYPDGSQQTALADSIITLPFKLIPTPLKGHPVSTVLSGIVAPADTTARLHVVTHFEGQHQLMTAEAIPYFTARSKRGLPQSSLAEQLAAHPFLRLIADSTLIVRPGVWKIETPVVVPDGYALHIPEGTTLQFAENQFLLVSGTVRFEGTPLKPIVLEGAAGPGGRRAHWQGVVVLQAPVRSRWTSVTVRDTKGIDERGWVLTGGVTFYKSDVDIRDCLFDGNIGEDALNVIHSDMTLVKSTISNTASDGFDGDFVTGTIRDCRFEQIGTTTGGDALDCSGSVVSVEGCRFRHITDKAVSVGERSNLTVENIDVEDAVSGVACKDGSSLTLRRAVFRKIGVAAVMAYSKKPIYGPATVVADNLQAFGATDPWRVQMGSTMRLDGRAVAAENIDVDVLYRSVMKKARP